MNCKCSEHVRNGSERIGHCGKCHITFYGTTAFDKHLGTRNSEGYAAHIDPATAGELWWQDEHTRWHYGERGNNPWANSEK